MEGRASAPLMGALADLATATADLRGHIGGILEASASLGRDTSAIKVHTSTLNEAFANIRVARDAVRALTSACDTCHAAARRAALVQADRPVAELARTLGELGASEAVLRRHASLPVAREALAAAAGARARLVGTATARLRTALRAAAAPAGVPDILAGCPEIETIRASLSPYLPEDPHPLPRPRPPGAGPLAGETFLPARVAEVQDVMAVALSAGGVRELLRTYGEERATQAEALTAAARDYVGAAGGAGASRQGLLVALHAAQALVGRELRGMVQLFGPELAARAPGASDALTRARVVHSVLSLAARAPLAALADEARALCGAPESPDKVFLLLDLHTSVEGARAAMARAVGDACREFNGPLADPAAAETAAPVEALAGLLSALVRAMEASVGEVGVLAGGARAEGARTAVPTVSPLAAAAVAHLRRLHERGGALFAALRGGRAPGADGLAERLRATTLRVTGALEAELASAAGGLGGEAEAALFLAANRAYVLRMLGQTGAAASLGRPWADEQRAAVLAQCQKYKESAWGPVLQGLALGAQEVAFYRGFAGPLPDAVRDGVKARFRAFNAAARDLHRRHTAWELPGAGVRDRLLRSLAHDVVGAYGEFLEAHRGLMFTRHPERFLVYTVDRLWDALREDLLSGRAAPAHLPPLPEGGAGARRGSKLLGKLRGAGELERFDPQVPTQFWHRLSASVQGQGQGQGQGAGGSGRGGGPAAGEPEGAPGPGAARPGAPGPGPAPTERRPAQGSHYAATDRAMPLPGPPVAGERGPGPRGHAGGGPPPSSPLRPRTGALDKARGTGGAGGRGRAAGHGRDAAPQ